MTAARQGATALADVVFKARGGITMACSGRRYRPAPAVICIGKVSLPTTIQATAAPPLKPDRYAAQCQRIGPVQCGLRS